MVHQLVGFDLDSSRLTRAFLADAGLHTLDAGEPTAPIDPLVEPPYASWLSDDVLIQTVGMVTASIDLSMLRVLRVVRRSIVLRNAQGCVDPWVDSVPDEHDPTRHVLERWSWRGDALQQFAIPDRWRARAVMAEDPLVVLLVSSKGTLGLWRPVDGELRVADTELGARFIALHDHDALVFKHPDHLFQLSIDPHRLVCTSEPLPYTAVEGWAPKWGAASDGPTHQQVVFTLNEQALWLRRLFRHDGRLALGEGPRFPHYGVQVLRMPGDPSRRLYGMYQTPSESIGFLQGTVDDDVPALARVPTDAPRFWPLAFVAPG